MSPLRIFPLLAIVLGAIEVSPEGGARTFLAGRNFPSGETSYAAAVQDFNNDGVLDMERRKTPWRY